MILLQKLKLIDSRCGSSLAMISMNSSVTADEMQVRSRCLMPMLVVVVVAEVVLFLFLCSARYSTNSSRDWGLSSQEEGVVILCFRLIVGFEKREKKRGKKHFSFFAT